MGSGLSRQCLHEDKVLVTDEERLSIATLINEKTDQSWGLKPTSLDFFFVLWSENETSCLALLAQLKMLCHKEGRALSLKAEHVDTVIASWDKLHQLPVGVSLQMDAYFLRNNRDVQSGVYQSIQTVMQGLRVQHAPVFVTQAKRHHLQHHTFYHALELKVRAMHVLTKQLDLINSHSEIDVFLREIASFLIEFHDHEQKDRGLYTSVEQATAARATEWIVDALDLSHRAPKLVPVIEIFADWIIVLGTTMVWGPTSTMDLSELFFLFDEATVQAGMGEHHISNHRLLQLLAVRALVTGLCDKNPASIAPLMEYEADQMNVLASLSHYVHESIIIQRFLTSDGSLLPYFHHAPILANQQAWLTTWIPHLNMRAEICVADPSVSNVAIEFIQLLSSAQEIRAAGMNAAELSHWFCLKNSHGEVQKMLESLFFLERNRDTEVNGSKQTSVVSGIQGEINFSKSQAKSLIFASQKIPELLFLLDRRIQEQTMVSLGIEPTVPLTDAQNMEKFGQFYFSCSEAEKAQLTQELFFVSVLQMGTEYALRPELSYQVVSTPMVSDIKVGETEETIKITPSSQRHSHFFKEGRALNPLNHVDEVVMLNLLDSNT
ncbi:MAG TPA: hypothetical protein DDY37_08405 [Legionella sp.]|nr:hypothetical protein [Legionella sp.]